MFHIYGNSHNKLYLIIKQLLEEFTLNHKKSIRIKKYICRLNIVNFYIYKNNTIYAVYNFFNMICLFIPKNFISINLI